MDPRDHNIFSSSVDVDYELENPLPCYNRIHVYPRPLGCREKYGFQDRKWAYARDIEISNTRVDDTCDATMAREELVPPVCVPMEVPFGEIINQTMGQSSSRKRQICYTMSSSNDEATSPQCAPNSQSSSVSDNVSVLILGGKRSRVLGEIDVWGAANRCRRDIVMREYDTHR